MKLRNMSIILLALLLAAMAMVPMVSAADSQRISAGQDIIEANYIPADTAREQATITMLNMIRSGALDENWVGAKINPNPDTIFDISGKKMYYQFIVKKGDTDIGAINAAANKVLGGSVISIGQFLPSIKSATLTEYSKKLVKDKFGDYHQISNQPVSIDYPIITQMISLKQNDTGDEIVIFIDDGSCR